MRPFLAACIACCLLLAQAFAQVPPERAAEYNRNNSKGVELIRAGKFDEGIAAFTANLEIVKTDAVSAYNLACCHALKKELDKAFEWLDKAVEWGFAYGDGNSGEGSVQLAKTDADLENLRADPRFAVAIEKMAAQKKALDEYIAAPIVYIPEKLAGAETVGLLLVFHDGGETKEKAQAQGPWKKLADELGLALIIPSGKVLAGRKPEDGMAWFGDSRAYADAAWKFERPADDAVVAFKKQHKLDPARVYAVGVGQGATVAFNFAISKSGLYKGVVAIGGGLNLTLAQTKSQLATKNGLQARVCLPNAGDQAAAYEKHAADVEAAFKRWSLAGTVERYTPAANAPEQIEPMVKGALEAFAKAPPPAPTPVPAQPAEAGGEKKP